MTKHVNIIGAGLAGSEAALQLAIRGVAVTLVEQRPVQATPVHRTDLCAELVCSNSFKSTKPESAAGMLKRELEALGSQLLAHARAHQVPAGGALATDREQFARSVTDALHRHPLVEVVRAEACGLLSSGAVEARDAGGRRTLPAADALVIATGPLTSQAFEPVVTGLAGGGNLAFYDAAAPIVMADSLDRSIVFRQSRYEDPQGGDYLNAPFSRKEYDRFIAELLAARRVIAREFEPADLFQACQPIEEIARAGHDAPRFGPLKPVGLTDPRTGRRPWAALQLRAEDKAGQSYNLVGFQTNLAFPEQKRVFHLVPGLQDAEFARYGVMHRNTYVNAPAVLDSSLRVRASASPVYLAGQVCGTEGYCEAIRSGLHVALCAAAELQGARPVPLPSQTAFGALLRYATDPATQAYQPMHVNFGIMEPLDPPVRGKQERYRAYAMRGADALDGYVRSLRAAGLLEQVAP